MSDLLTDALGSVMADFSNAVGAATLADNQVYGPYGNLLYSANGTMGTARGYTGQYSDPLTGLDYYVSRYYDPVAGIFLSADTKEGNAQGMNPYAYVAQNPETLTDPSGQYFAPPGGNGNGDPNPPSCEQENDCNKVHIDYPTPQPPPNGRTLNLKHQSSSHASNDGIDWLKFGLGLGELALGAGVLITALISSADNPIIFVAKWLLKNALGGVIWLMNDGLRNMRAAIPHLSPVISLMFDMFAIAMDLAQMANNLENLSNLTEFREAAVEIKNAAEAVNLLFDHPVYEDPGMFVRAAENRLTGGGGGLILGFGTLVDDIVDLENDWNAAFNSH
ncbi:MAG: RHS repeat-associated core domain-containing protein [Ktedonobacteraceae bacterium]